MSAPMSMGRFRGAYPEDWTTLAARVKTEAGWRCIRCRHPHDPNGRRACIVRCDEACRHPQIEMAGGKYSDRARCLTVHHLDGDKSNARWWNLLALCQVCHLQIQAKVVPERAYLWEHADWFKPFVAGFYAAYYDGREITRAEAEADLDRWLALGQPHLYTSSSLSSPLAPPAGSRAP